MIIGITGYLSAGKGESADYLASKHGFSKRGYGDTIRAEMTENGIELGRDNEYAYANKLRSEHGFGYWTKKIAQSINPQDKVVIEGIRNKLEIEELSKVAAFKLIFVDAPVEMRYERMLSRVGRTNEPKTLAQFVEQENRERHNTDPAKQSIDDCVAKADFKVRNSGDINQLHQQLDKIVEEITNDQR
ncbi:MAG: AAA family ATPase [Patescibacteria group bacterium]|jgi:dephospho-CoA kinase